MDELVTHLLRVVVNGRESDIALVVHPHRQGVEVSHQHPLPDIELPLQHNQRVLDVLLGYPQGLLAADVVLNLHVVVIACDPPAPG